MIAECVSRVVIDTNCVLDLWVFDDPASAPLKHMITSGKLKWIITPAMRDEWVRVMEYPAIQRARQQRGVESVTALKAAAPSLEIVAAPPRCPVQCLDPDDQMFIDLAVAEKARLISKDKQVLALRPELTRHGVAVLKPLQIKNLIV